MERVKINNLSKRYSDRLAFQHINFSFYAGKTIGLLGDNGAGKTTLIKLICGLIHPDDGQVFVNGIDIQKQRSKSMQGLGVFLEGYRSTYWRLTAWQNLLYFSGLKGTFGKAAHNQAENLLKKFDLWDERNIKVETLSFGMKQRLALACSVSHDPSIILLDEPTSGLDRQSNVIFESFIHQLATENKLVIIASHDHDMIKRISDSALIIKGGTLNYVF
ncbi:MAG: ABC transporter ATP-binding protein [Parachlamydiaceae bacterium]